MLGLAGPSWTRPIEENSKKSNLIYVNGVIMTRFQVGSSNGSIDFWALDDIENDVKRIDLIIGTNIFSPENRKNPLVKSAFIEVLICLRDLMAKSEKISSRISFVDDVNITPNVKDVTDLITFVRDALCHPESQKHYIKPREIKASYNILYGKDDDGAIEHVQLKSEYEDDVCFFFGEQKIYLKRHIIRSLDEAKEKLMPVSKFFMPNKSDS
jgi:hypothetical protein